MDIQANRYMGCLAGLAVGDALGTTLEFHRVGTFEPITDMVGGGPFRLDPGQWTDDTSMALCLAASLIETGEFNPADQMDRYSRWLERGYMSCRGYCFDVGMTVRAALLKYSTTNDPAAGDTDPNTAGNGSLMRLAPIPMFYSDARVAISFSGKSSVTTHAATTCVDACRFYGGLIWGALHDVPKEQLLASRYSPTGDWVPRLTPLLGYGLCPEIMTIAEGSYKTKQPPDIRGTGYVVESLEAALWAFYHSTDFRTGALLAVNLGEDADTTGAIYGQLAGAYYGYSDIPQGWLDKLAWRDMIADISKSLMAKAEA